MKNLSLTVLLLAPLAVAAHAGHGVFTADHIGHYLTSPVHALPLGLLVVLLAMVVIGHFRQRARARRLRLQAAKVEH